MGGKTLHQLQRGAIMAFPPSTPTSVLYNQTENKRLNSLCVRRRQEKQRGFKILNIVFLSASLLAFKEILPGGGGAAFNPSTREAEAGGSL